MNQVLNRRQPFLQWFAAMAIVCLVGGRADAQNGAGAPATPTTAPPSQAAVGVTPPADYVIGPDDVLQIVFWKEPDLSRDVIVRPDGMITLPLINDIAAVGKTPEQLRVSVTSAAENFMQGEPTVNVIVKEIKSRKVFITGQVGSPGPYPLLAPTTVIQLIALAGGLAEYADTKNIVILRTDERGQQTSVKFNYADVRKGKNLRQNIALKPGDTVIVP